MSDISKDHIKTTPASNDQASGSNSSSCKTNRFDGTPKDGSVKPKDSSKKSSKSPDSNSFDKLAQIMLTGFTDLKSILSEQQVSYDCQYDDAYDYVLKI